MAVPRTPAERSDVLTVKNDESPSGLSMRAQSVPFARVNSVSESELAEMLKLEFSEMRITLESAKIISTSAQAFVVRLSPIRREVSFATGSIPEEFRISAEPWTFETYASTFDLLDTSSASVPVMVLPLPFCTV